MTLQKKLKALYDLGDVQLSIVVGAVIFGGDVMLLSRMERSSADYMGMLATF